MTTHRIRWVLALFLGLAILAAACGSDSDDSGNDDGSDAAAADSETDEEADDAADEGEADEGEADEADDAEETDDTEATESEDAAEEADDSDMAMEPQYGGSLTYLLEAESDTWDVPNANCAESCINVMRAVADPMMIINEDREIEPFLLESMESNEDFTEWTLVMRDGVTFHDGTPVDGAAIQRNLVETANGALTGQLLRDLENGADSIELVDDMTVTLKFSRPVSVLPNFFAERVGAWVYAPAYWDNPDRAGAMPISTGPFRMTEWNRDESTVLERNEDYWRADAAGNQLPYLDEVIFRPNPDAPTRTATMEGGDADVNMESVNDNEEFWRTTWIENGGGIVDAEPERQSFYLMFNNSKPPFDNIDARRAIAMCTDRDEYIVFRHPDNELADGPFIEGTLGYVADTGIPDFDPEAGSALWDEIGRPDTIVQSYFDTPANGLNFQLLADQWSTHCGLTVEPDGFDQSEQVTRALTGSFEVMQWRNHGNEVPGWEETWWHSRHAEGLALNFGRMIDADLDALLDETWATTDPAELDALAQDINVVLGTNVFNLWLNYSDWIHAYAEGVHNVNHMTLHSGKPAMDALAGRIWVQEAWKEG